MRVPTDRLLGHGTSCCHLYRLHDYVVVSNSFLRKEKLEVTNESLVVASRDSRRPRSPRDRSISSSAMRLAFESVVTADLASFVGLPAAGSGGHPWKYGSTMFCRYVS